MKKIVVSVIVLALIVGSLFVLKELNVFDKLNDEELTTTIGRIAYVSYYGKHDNKEIDKDAYFIYLYVAPLGNTTNDNWIIFTVSADTELESKEVEDLLSTPELTRGSVVEIVHNADINNPRVDKNSRLLIEGFFAESIKVTDVSTENLKGQDIPLVLNESYDIKEVETGRFENTMARIAKVVKVDAPISGYIVYLQESERSDLIRCWVDEGTRVDEEMAAILESGKAGSLIRYLSKQSHPFVNENEDICGLVYLYLEAP